MRGLSALAVAFVVAAAGGASCTCGAGQGGSTEERRGDAGVVGIGEDVTGRFTPDLPRDDLNKAYIDYRLTIEEAGTYQIELTSENTGVYDPYLRLLREGREVASDDDGSDAPLQSRIVHDLEPGAYVVRVTKFGSQQVEEATGFTLHVARVERPTSDSPPAPTPLAVGAPTVGTFGTTLPLDGAGIPYVEHSLTVTEAGTYRIDLQSADTRAYDPFIRLLRDGREVATDDDGGDAALQARLELPLEPGDYLVRATKYGPGPVRGSVDFTLTVTRVGGATGAEAAPSAGGGDANRAGAG